MANMSALFWGCVTPSVTVLTCHMFYSLTLHMVMIDPWGADCLNEKLGLSWGLWSGASINTLYDTFGCLWFASGPRWDNINTKYDIPMMVIDVNVHPWPEMSTNADTLVDISGRGWTFPSITLIGMWYLYSNLCHWKTIIKTLIIVF